MTGSDLDLKVEGLEIWVVVHLEEGGLDVKLDEQVSPGEVGRVSFGWDGVVVLVGHVLKIAILDFNEGVSLFLVGFVPGFVGHFGDSLWSELGVVVEELLDPNPSGGGVLFPFVFGDGFEFLFLSVDKVEEVVVLFLKSLDLFAGRGEGEDFVVGTVVLSSFGISNGVLETLVEFFLGDFFLSDEGEEVLVGLDSEDFETSLLDVVLSLVVKSTETGFVSLDEV